MLFRHNVLRFFLPVYLFDTFKIALINKLILICLLGSDLQPYNTPQIGQLNEVYIEVSMETASGEVGFAEPHKRIVKEPEGTTSTTHVIYYHSLMFLIKCYVAKRHVQKH